MMSLFSVYDFVRVRLAYFTVSELGRACAILDVPKTGNKSVIQERLYEHLRSIMNETDFILKVQRILAIRDYSLPPVYLLSQQSPLNQVSQTLNYSTPSSPLQSTGTTASTASPENSRRTIVTRRSSGSTPSSATQQSPSGSQTTPRISTNKDLPMVANRPFPTLPGANSNIPNLPTSSPNIASVNASKSTPSEPSISWKRTACFCGIIPNDADDIHSVIPCSTAGCGLIFHANCLGLSVAVPTLVESLSKEWKCPICRAASMMAFAEIQAVLGKPIITKSFPRTSHLIKWTQDIPSYSLVQDKRDIRVVSCPLGVSSASVCLWPEFCTLVVNNASVTIPRPQTQGSSAALLSISNLTKCSVTNPNGSVDKNENMLVVKPGAPVFSSNKIPDETYAIMVLLVKNFSSDESMQSILNTRIVRKEYSLAMVYAATQLSTRPNGRWLNMYNYSLNSVSKSYLPKIITKLIHENISAKQLHSKSTETDTNASVERQDTSKFHIFDQLEGYINKLRSDNVIQTKPDEDPDIEISPITFNLVDVASRSAITIPVRGDNCSHIQCFDLATYFTLNSGPKAKWKCIICRRMVFPSQIYIDYFMLEILMAIHSNSSTQWDVIHDVVTLDKRDYDEKNQVYSVSVERNFAFLNEVTTNPSKSIRAPARSAEFSLLSSSYESWLKKRSQQPPGDIFRAISSPYYSFASRSAPLGTHPASMFPSVKVVENVFTTIPPQISSNGISIPEKYQDGNVQVFLPQIIQFKPTEWEFNAIVSQTAKMEDGKPVEKFDSNTSYWKFTPTSLNINAGSSSDQNEGNGTSKSQSDTADAVLLLSDNEDDVGATPTGKSSSRTPIPLIANGLSASASPGNSTPSSVSGTKRPRDPKEEFEKMIKFVMSSDPTPSTRATPPVDASDIGTRPIPPPMVAAIQRGDFVDLT
jgi:MIZ/SP-RING zinc finger